MAHDAFAHGKDGKAVLFAPVLVHAELDRQPVRSTRERRVADAVGLEAEDEMDMRETRASYGREGSYQQRRAGNWSEKFRVTGNAVEPIAVACREDDCLRYKRRLW